MNEKPSRFTPPVITLCVLAVATALKAWWALNSVGSMDVVVFWKFAQYLDHDSLKYMYETYVSFNHTPLTAMIVHGLRVVALTTDPPETRVLVFASMLRFLSIFADIGLVAGLLHVRKLTGNPPWWAIYAFAASPVSLIISGFHGNMDPVMVMFMFLAGVAVLHERPALSGVLLAIAFNIKIVPIVLVPAFFFYWLAKGRKQAAAFTVAVAAGFFLGAAVPLVQCPHAYISHVLGYGSVWGAWGLTYWLRLTGMPDLQIVDFRNLSAHQNAVMAVLKLIIVGTVTVIAWKRRNKGGNEFFATLGMIWTVVFVFAPGGAVQYMPWFAPFILMLSPRWWAALTAASTVVLVVYYHPNAKWQFPWDLAQASDDRWIPWTNLPWAVFLGIGIYVARKAWMESRVTEPAVTLPVEEAESAAA